MPAISAVKSNIVLKGEIMIRNNSGINGGGLVLCEASYILFSPHTTVTFEENKALLSGGGIYAEERCLQSKPLCFVSGKQFEQLFKQLSKELDIRHHPCSYDKQHCQLHRKSDIWGEQWTNCTTTFNENNTYVYSKIFNETLWQVNKTQDPSYITSNPKHVCFCENEKYICSKKSTDISIYPGEQFNISQVAVGQFHNPVPATISSICWKLE